MIVNMSAKQILELINQKPRITPKMIALETGIPDQRVRTTLSNLNDLGVIKTVARGVYEVTSKGKQLLKD